MEKAKKQVNMRLPSETVQELEALAEKYKISQAQVIAVLVHHYSTGTSMEELSKWFYVAKIS